MGLSILWLVPALPLVGAIVNGIWAGKVPRKLVSVIGVGSVGLSFAIALACFGDLLSLSPEQRRVTQTLYTWLQVGDFRADVRLMLDPLSAVMMLVVTGVGFLIHAYSTGYMGHEKAYGRYFAYLNLFTFSMLTLVLADNFLLMFLGWEAVGLCSYLLIGFWYERPAAAEAGKKAFVVNRIGDWGFLLGIFLIFVTFGSVDFGTVFAQAPQRLAVGSTVASGIALLLFLGATGKSAQIPLYVWLPDAMEGPTPVSALIHAATMVTAGVYMVARCHVLYLLSPLALQTVAIVGIATVLLAATIAVTQNDIKRVLAYSTISQLGYMFVGCGVGAFTSGIFHLMTHAFFKALLFLGAGSVIHALSNEQDLWKMGGLRRHLPKTHLTFLIGTLAIAGVIPFAGFFSKDEILFQTWLRGGPLLWCAGIFGAFLTAFYMFRLYFLTFHGAPRMSEELKQHIHESPNSMTIPLMILALLSTIGGFIQIPLIQGGQILDRFLEPVFADASALAPAAHAGHTPMAEVWLMAISLAVALVAILVAYRFYVASPETPRRLAERARGLYRLVANKYFVDEAYDATVIQPIYRGSVKLWHDFDEAVIDGAVNGVGHQIERGSAFLRSVQTGYVQFYALLLTLGAVIVIGYLALR